jgi:hypothetical protein
VAQSKEDILKEIGLINVQLIYTPMDPNAKLLPNKWEPFTNPEKRLVAD